MILQGKVERETLGVASKIPGRITEIKVAEGQSVQKGDTLAIIDIPEVTAKMLQAEGAVTSAKAQYSMSVKGATDGQLKQLQAKYNALKEQYEFAPKSITRLNNMLVDRSSLNKNMTRHTLNSKVLHPSSRRLQQN